MGQGNGETGNELELTEQDSSISIPQSGPVTPVSRDTDVVPVSNDTESPITSDTSIAPIISNDTNDPHDPNDQTKEVHGEAEESTSSQDKSRRRETHPEGIMIFSNCQVDIHEIHNHMGGQDTVDVEKYMMSIVDGVMECQKTIGSFSQVQERLNKIEKQLSQITESMSNNHIPFH